MKETLTHRQQELLTMLLNGIPPKEIAYNLHITYNTLLFHKKNLYGKLGVHNVHELIAKCLPEVCPALRHTRCCMPPVTLPGLYNLRGRHFCSMS
ncbi:MAG: helix-turn-helix transcriptional regulator [Spirochaetaceae bacterium]|nr:helix-turn-helix transcriptional regulator [Spirochaetaceae bacterium]